jgi:hypothetical protein
MHVRQRRRRQRLEQKTVSFLLGQPRDHARDFHVGRESERRPHPLARSRLFRGPKRIPVDGVVDDVDLFRVCVNLPGVELTHRSSRRDDAIRSAHQQPFGQDVMPPLAFVDVHLGANHDRHVLEQRREPSVQARRQEKRMENGGPLVTQIAPDAAEVARAAQPGCETEHRYRRSCLADLLADRSRVVNAAHDRLKSRRQMLNQIEHHFFGATDGEGVRHIDHADTRLGHEATCAR